MKDQTTGLVKIRLRQNIDRNRNSERKARELGLSKTFYNIVLTRLKRG